MIGSIVLTLEGIENISKKTLKNQDANHQAMRFFNVSNLFCR